MDTKDFVWTDELAKEYGNYLLNERVKWFNTFKGDAQPVPESMIFEQFKKSKQQILFITEDGVKLYDKKQEVFSVKIGEYNIFNAYSGNSIGAWINGWYTTQWIPNPIENDIRVMESLAANYKIFSTEEKAKEYCLFNNPCLSLNDLLSVWSRGNKMVGAEDTIQFNSFRQVAQDKLTNIKP